MDVSEFYLIFFKTAQKSLRIFFRSNWDILKLGIFVYRYTYTCDFLGYFIMLGIYLGYYIKSWDFRGYFFVCDFFLD